MSKATTYTVGQILSHKHAVCEETGVEVIEISPRQDPTSLKMWNSFMVDPVVSINVLPSNFTKWLKVYQAFCDMQGTKK